MDVLFIVDPLILLEEKGKTEMQKIIKEKPYFTECTRSKADTYYPEEIYYTNTTIHVQMVDLTEHLSRVRSSAGHAKNFSSIPILEQYSNNNGKVPVPTLEI
jgi:hypothetical protein